MYRKNFFKYKIYSLSSNLYYYLGLVIISIIGTMLFRYGLDFMNFFNFNYGSVRVVHFFLLLVLWIIFEAVGLFGEKLSQKFKDFREPSYLERYGEDFKDPTFEDFGITKEEYRTFVNITQIDYEFLSYFPGLGFIIFLFKNQEEDILFFAYAVLGFILLLILFKIMIMKVNKYIYKKNPPNKKAVEYLNAIKIYHKIQREKIEMNEKDLF